MIDASQIALRLTPQDTRRAMILAEVFGVGGVGHSTWKSPEWPTTASDGGIKVWGPLPHRNADAQVQVKFVASKISLCATDIAIWHLAGIGDEGRVEVLLAGTGVAHDCGLPFLVGLAGGKAAWQTASERATKYVGDLRRAVWPLARAKAPGAQILEAANAVNDRNPWGLPTGELLEACRVIARSTISGSARR